MLRLLRWKYRCGECHHDYDLPGVDLSFFYGWFLGVSPCADAVAFDTVSFQGFDELKELIDSLGQELPEEDPGLWTAKALTEVCDPDTLGDRYVFSGTPGCPTCTSTQVESFSETQQPWEHTARAATHGLWDSMSRTARLDRLRVSLGLHQHETENNIDLDGIEERYRHVITESAGALLAGAAAEQCQATGLAQIETLRRDAMRQIDEYTSQPLLPANIRWRLVTKTDHMHQRALDDLGALVQPHL